ncbi:anhydro-N-acetylmuramic acid kinase [Rhizobacter sp. J219]|uniref:anhydro-N-acetylmuramic acid kinase n=1 Tax=Rhizobacter sp. J219 TaxID=2898430 RepID=UPI002150A84B|nr:anhydro-N-acetylmuramic acid kinase [Rhizobacter sp. J219]MCR5885361.1 anhydro-N-acetylmuramic acid kinase [Rhizobacter sp. J219]
MAELFAGLMSGTSLDGVDGVLAEFSAAGFPKVVSHAYRAFPETLREELLALNTSGPDELHRSALASNALAALYIEVVGELLANIDIDARAVRAIGSHGQTVRHRPGLGYTWQINNPSLLAERSGIAVVADFRTRDVAAGGQGAPLVAAFHRALFGQAGETRAVLNLGGISNLTALLANGDTTGFDCGPANVLMDLWCLRHTGQRFDADGAWAAQGAVQPGLLSVLLQEPYFTEPPPKSTGRDLFNVNWLEDRLRTHGPCHPVDVQATLCELTAVTCTDAIKTHASDANELLVCGGGALNLHLMGRLAHHLPGMAVRPSDAHGLPAQHVEAAAFAWLAYRHAHGLPGNLSAVTGASGPRVLGAWYPA